MFLSLFHWLVYTYNPGTVSLIFNILFFSVQFSISPLKECSDQKLIHLFMVDKSDVNNKHRTMRKKLQKQLFADILQNRCS